MENTEINQDNLKLSDTYEESAFKFIAKVVEERNEHTQHLFNEQEDKTFKLKPEIEEGIIRFSHYLDGFNVLDKNMQILAMVKVHEVDKEFIDLLVKELPPKKVQKVANIIVAKHKKDFPQQEEKPNEPKESI